MQIDGSDEHSANTSRSIRQSFDGFSKMTSRREWHEQKQFEQRISTERGRQIDESPEQLRKADDSILESRESFSKKISMGD
jgi:hypothetical protein